MYVLNSECGRVWLPSGRMILLVFHDLIVQGLLTRSATCPVWLPLGRMIMFEYLGEEMEEGDAVEGVVSGQGSADADVAEGTFRVGKSDEPGTEGGERKEEGTADR